MTFHKPNIQENDEQDIYHIYRGASKHRPVMIFAKYK